MKNVAKFEKVSIEEFKRCMMDLYNNYYFRDEEIKLMYETIRVPTRATKGSVGYDFVTPFSFKLSPGTKIWIPSGIRCIMYEEDYALFIMPKSRNSKNSIRLSNTIAVVDPDYYMSDNEGHIMITLEMPVNYIGDGVYTRFGEMLCKNKKPMEYTMGDQIAQGIFMEVGKCVGEKNISLPNRNGGHGSTGK